MGWLNSDDGGYNADNNPSSVYGGYVNGSDERKATLSHEVIAGAAAYEAAKAYENHVAANGQPASHAEAKEVFAGFAGAFVDREAETKGLDFIDSEKAKRQAVNQFPDQDSGQWQQPGQAYNQY